jgi:hypothetical protein
LARRRFSAMLDAPMHVHFGERSPIAPHRSLATMSTDLQLVCEHIAGHRHPRNDPAFPLMNLPHCIAGRTPNDVEFLTAPAVSQLGSVG